MPHCTSNRELSSSLHSSLQLDSIRVLYADRSLSQLDVFMKECVLPLAIKSQALIIVEGFNDSSSAMSLERIVTPVQRRMGAACPFKVSHSCPYSNSYSYSNL